MTLPPHHGEAWDFIDEFLVVEIFLCKDLSKHIPREKMHKLLQAKDMNIIMTKSEKETLLWVAYLRLEREKAQSELRSIFEQNTHALSDFLTANKKIAKNCEINVQHTFGNFIEHTPGSLWYDRTVNHIIDQLFMSIRSHVIADILRQHEDAAAAE